MITLQYFSVYLAFGLLFQLVLDRQVRKCKGRWTLGMFIISVFFWPVPFAIAIVSSILALIFGEKRDGSRNKDN